MALIFDMLLMLLEYFRTPNIDRKCQIGWYYWYSLVEKQRHLLLNGKWENLTLQLTIRITQWSFQTQFSGLSNSITISKCMVGVLIIVCFMFVFDIKYWLDQTVQTMNYPVEYKREQMIDYFLCTSPFWKDCSKKKILQ